MPILKSILSISVSVTCLCMSSICASGTDSFIPTNDLQFASYTNELIGLTGNGSERYKFSTGVSRNQPGQLAGISGRYDGVTGVDLGTASWLYNGATTTRIGFFGAGYTDSNGLQSSYIDGLNEAGHVLGSSYRYDNTTGVRAGTAAWLYDGATTTRIGFFDAEHTDSETSSYGPSNQTSFIIDFNETGQVVGYSSRYGADDHLINRTFKGRTAWLYSNGEAIKLGFYDAAYTSYSGYKESTIAGLNEAGQVAGSSFRYNDTNRASVGSDAWIYDGATTTKIGLSGAGYIDSNGERKSSSISLNEAGQVIGHSTRYDNATGVRIGNSAWLYDGATTSRIGLFGAEFTASDGTEVSVARDLNEAGQVAGTSIQYYFNSHYGDAAWLYDGTSTTRIGLFDAEHTGNTGHQTSRIHTINEAGQVVGNSDRYTSSGRSAWLHSGGVTTRLGFYGVDHTRSDGYQFSDVFDLNDAGQVAGYSYRYNGLSKATSEAWLFDSTLEQTFVINVATANAQSSGIRFTHLGSDGLVLGYYDYSSGGTILEEDRPFAYTIENGFVDLMKLAKQGGTDTGWGLLEQVYWENDKIVGFGLTSGAYLQQIYTPIPATVWLFCSGILIMLGHVKRKVS